MTEHQPLWPIFDHDTIESTQDEAKRLFHLGNTALPFAVMARVQTAGRGRSGRSWSSYPNNLMTTFAIGVNLPARYAGQYAFVIGVAITDLLAEIGIAHATLKWPNDVLIDGSKIAGILLESQINSNQNISELFVGIGLNITEAPIGAIAINDLIKSPVTREHMAHRLQYHIAAALDDFDQNGFASIREKWLSRAYGIDKSITVRLPHTEFSGQFKGLSPDGSLIVTKDGQDEPCHIYAGDVFFGVTDATNN